MTLGEGVERFNVGQDERRDFHITKGKRDAWLLQDHVGYSCFKQLLKPRCTSPGGQSESKHKHIQAQGGPSHALTDQFRKLAIF